MINKVLINGIEADYINISDRSIHYGDGIFETILLADNKILLWSQHYQRLKESAKKLKLICPDEQVLLDDVKKLKLAVEESSVENFTIKIILSRGNSARGYKFDTKASGNRIVIFSELSAEYSSLLTEQLISGELTLCKHQVSINESLAGLKHLNRIDNVMARNEWHDERFIDGLMMNANHHVIEGTMSNLFAVNEGQLYTPKLLQSGVNGIIRNKVIEIAGSMNINVSIIDISLEEIKTMDELFITNSLIGMKSVNKFIDCAYEFKVTKLIFSELLKSMDSHVQII